MDCDIEQNLEDQIKQQIERHLSSYGYIDKINGINRYLEESKVNLDVFDFIDKSRSQSWLINEKIKRYITDNNEGEVIFRLFEGLSYEIKDKFIFFIDYINLTAVKKEKYIEIFAKDISDFSRSLIMSSGFIKIRIG